MPLLFFSSGRVVFLPFDSASQGSGSSPRNTKGSQPKQEKVEKPRFETCPSQPRLLIHFSSGAFADQGKPMQISLADGELFTLPSLRLTNYRGPSGHGALEQLQIFAVDMPGIPDHKLFDSDDQIDQPATISDEEFARLSIEGEGKSPPFQLRVLDSSSLKLEDINHKGGTGCCVSFQIGAAQDMKRHFRNGSIIKIRFRYRGASTSYI